VGRGWEKRQKEWEGWKGREREERKVETAPPSIPVYAPARCRNIFTLVVLYSLSAL